MKLLILFLLVAKNVNAQDGILCSAKTCSDYITENPCPALPDNCKIQNATYNGLFLPNPDPCNCCSYCLVNLNEGDYCAVGEDGGLVPESICGPGLSCSGGLCVKMTELSEDIPVCSGAQADYDKRRNDENDSLGSMEVRPNCDDDGLYQPYKCVPGQTCFCLDKEGNRIFGEIPFASNADVKLRCGCSRKYNEILKFFDGKDLYPHQHFRCTANGDYDTIQCIGENCMCTDTLDGAPTWPGRDTVNITDISEDTLPECYKARVHLKGKYHYACAEKYISVLEEIEEYKGDGYDTVFEVSYPNCGLDGKYAPVQKEEKDINTGEISFYCALPNGDSIESYRGSSTDTIEIDCKCARSRLLMAEDAPEKPQCCRNGNFNKVQCRRGTCYCVDSDGYQDVSGSPFEVTSREQSQLFCYDEAYQAECNSE